VSDADPKLTITGCDSVLVDGQFRPRVTFQLQNLEPGRIICEFIVFPQTKIEPIDSCVVLQPFAPSGWFANQPPNLPGGLDWVGPCILPGEIVTGFQVVLDRPRCCFFAQFTNILLDFFGDEVICFGCEPPVPASHAAWGKIKAQYR
jgi:hypothetical protein